LNQKFTKFKTGISGAYRRQLEVIEELEFVTSIPKDKLLQFFKEDEFALISESNMLVEIVANDAVKLKFHLADEDNFSSIFFKTSCSPEFLFSFKNTFQWNENEKISSEKEIFSKNNLNYIPPFLREKETIISKAKENNFENVIQTSEIKGLIHSHSNWSDGAYTIDQMVEELIALGFEYLVISDHSKAAFYANGLSEQKIKEQHKYIDELNKKYAPFKIFKSIECDILNDGAMDYSNEILSTFDLVIASIHSNLDMPEEKAMKRLLGAISNPYVTILGHMTGRVLLRRKGYPVDYKTIIDACAENNVVIEINASPSRLDMNWNWIDYALEKNVVLSIDPDAHSLDEFHSIKWGVAVAQKGGLTKENNLSSFSLTEFEEFLKVTRLKKGIN
jgi:DNA polymerase (family 10)